MKARHAPWAEEIEQIRQQLRLNQASLARLLGVSPMAPSRSERGINEPTAEIYIRLGKLAGPLECWKFWRRAGLEQHDLMGVLSPVVQLDDDISSGSALAVVPILRNPLRYLTAKSLPKEQVLGRIAVPRRLYDHAERVRCFFVPDDAMSPMLRRGFLVAASPESSPASQPENRIVAVRQGRTITLCWRHSASNSAGRDLESSSLPRKNGKHAVTVLGEVVWWVGAAPVEALTMSLKDERASAS